MNRMAAQGPILRSVGVAASVEIATPTGWSAAGALQPGDLVLSFDGPPQRVAQCHRMALGADVPVTHWPLLVPDGAMHNRDALRLLPDQTLLVEDDLAEAMFGDPFALIPVQALEGWRGITRCHPEGREPVVSLSFARPQILYAAHGGLIGCPGEAPGLFADTPAQPVLSTDQALQLVTCLRAAEAGRALRAGLAGRARQAG